MPPQVGQLYLVDTIIYALGTDPAADRRAVVITVPPGPGSKSPNPGRRPARRRRPQEWRIPATSASVTRNGVFSDLVSVEQQLWRPGNVLLLGVLPEPYLSRVLSDSGESSWRIADETGRLGEAGAALLYNIIGVVAVAATASPLPRDRHPGTTPRSRASRTTSSKAPARPNDCSISPSARSTTDPSSVNSRRPSSTTSAIRLVEPDLGKLIVRVKEVLRASRAPRRRTPRQRDRWAAEGSPSEPSTTPARELAAAIRGEEHRCSQVNSATRDAPLADRDTFVRLMRSVLLTARGSLTARELQRCSQRASTTGACH